MNKNDIIKARASGHQAKLILKEISKDAVVQELKHQLAEKDKEIKKLSDCLLLEDAYEAQKKNGFPAKKIDIVESFIRHIRHQVCEELVERLGLKQMKKQFDINKVPVGELKMNYNTFMKVLDQIEGESNNA